MSIKYAGQIYKCGDDDASLRLRQRPHVIQSGHTVHDSPHAPAPRLEQGRWIVDCSCGSGAGVSNAGKAYCFECGAIMTVTLPPLEQRREAEAELLTRPERNRNWMPDRETIEQLKAEKPKRDDVPA